MGDTVLVVDDSITILELLAETLEPEGFRTLQATDGEDALGKLLTRADIVLVVCDVNMPRMNGLDLLASARTHGLATPFLMLTTEAQPEMIERARGLGAKGWMIKPVKPQLFLAAVKATIKRFRSTASTSREADGASSGPVTRRGVARRS
jgi:two-component system chemotaxis response regulator CheY